MKISELHVFACALPVKDGPYSMSGGDINALDTTLVKLVTDTGFVGWGETCPLGPLYAEAHADGARAAIAAMAPGLIGSSVLPLSVHRVMDSLLNGHNYAKAAIDIAVHDALAKSLDVRVVDLLGGAVTEHVPSYYAIGIETPEDAARIAARKRDEGYRRLQLKVGAHAPEIDIDVIRRVWDAIKENGMRLAVDANRGWTSRDAIRVSQACRDIPLVIEQPCSSIDEVQLLHSQVCHPVYLDESATDVNTVISLAGTNRVNGFGLKVTRFGGLQPMTTVRDICAVRNLPHTCDDSWGGDIIAAACVHLGATVRADLLEGVWLAEPYIDGHFDAVNGVKVVDGHIKLPEGKGLGVIPDENIIGEPIATF